jgi:hypothetical protein
MAGGWKRGAAFVGLVLVQVSLAYAFIGAQENGQYPFNPAATLVVCEAFKMVLSGVFLMSQHRGSPRAALTAIREQILSTKGILRHCVVLAALYALNNNITFLLFRWADGANINLVKGGSSFISTVLLRFAFQRDFTEVQWVAIGLQVCGLLVSQFGANSNEVPALAPVAYAVLLGSVTIT